MAPKGINGDFDNPEFVTQSGITLKLKRIAALVLRRWYIEYEKKHPKPEPPVIILENGAEWRDINDAYYQHLVNRWEEEQGNAFANWILANGIRSQPPQGWKPSFDLDYDDVPKHVLWAEEILGDTEIEHLIEAISSIGNATGEAVLEAEKNSTSE